MSIFDFLQHFVLNLLLANSEDIDQMLQFVVSGHGMYCLTISHEKDALYIWNIGHDVRKPVYSG